MSTDLAVIEAALEAATPGPWEDAVERIASRIFVNAEAGFWEWTGHTRLGYGVISIHCRNLSVHRMMYQAFVGGIQPGLEVDHICRNRGCCNPEHLRATTRKQNAENLAPSPMRGISWNERRRKWQVFVKSSGKSHFGGRFDDLGDAQRAARELRDQLFTHNTAERGVA